ncbi:MAG TPA: DUF5348 domain-containing protein [Epulopiscium sp.]|nr:DUF5348 domain-containing protein [Candidatus Epulonipiscium sp.]
MNDLQKVLSELTKITTSVRSVIKQSTYDKYDDLSGLDIDYTDPEQLLLLGQLMSMMDRLDDIKRKVEYLNRPIAYTGALSKNSDDRYELPNGDSFASGYDIEFLLESDHFFNIHGADAWVKTKLEYGEDDYYLFGYKEIPMVGLMARMRR